MATPKAQALNTRIDGQTTPMANLKLKLPAQKPKLTVEPLRTPGAGSNAQTQAMQNAMTKTYKTQKTFGVPGAK